MKKLYCVTLPISDGYTITGIVSAKSPEFAIAHALTVLGQAKPSVAAIAAESEHCRAEEISGPK